jgi:hypothetical protein
MTLTHSPARPSDWRITSNPAPCRWFGIGHCYGIPSGPVGVVVVAATGLLFGRAMIETRGLAWPWALHITIDLVIFAVMALAEASS